MEQTTTQTQPNDPKIRFNVKQSVKGVKTYDITCRGESIEEIKALFEKAEQYAFELGCIKATLNGAEE